MSSIVSLIDDFLNDCLDALPDTLSPQLKQIRERLSEPMRLAVIGATNAGKSTLVNSLLQKRVAPTDQLECTRHVAIYRFGVDEHVEIVRSDESAEPYVLDRAGMIPSELHNLMDDDVEYLNVWKNSRTLQEVTLIDTPGFDAADETTGTRTKAALRQHSIESLAFVISRVATDSQQDVIEDFLSTVREAHGSAVNTIGVVTKLDQFRDSRDLWEISSRYATRLESSLHLIARSVQPVLGLVAEAGSAQRITGDMFDTLKQVAHLPESSLKTTQSFAEASKELDQDERQTLLSVLGLYGVRYCVGLLSGGVDSVSEICDSLRNYSGLEDLRTKIRALGGNRSDALKARSALASLERLFHPRNLNGFESPPVGSLVRRLAELKSHRSLHVLTEIDAFESCARGSVSLPEEYVNWLRLFVTQDDARSRLGLSSSASVEDLKRVLERRSSELMAYMNTRATQPERHVCLVLSKSYAFLLEDLRAGRVP